LKTDIAKLNNLIKNSNHLLILQPEKPDADSLASTLALEEMLADDLKNITMFCYDEVPEHLRYLSGWDRVTDEFPKEFDFSILVDAGTPNMIERTLHKHGSKLSAKPFVVIDHHKIRQGLAFDTIDIIDGRAASVGELLVELAKTLKLKISLQAAKCIISSILADTMNLTTPSTTVKTVQAFTDMVKLGVNLAELHRDYEKMGELNPELFSFKGRLIERIQYFLDGKISLLVIQPDELTKFAKIHDPSDLVIQEMRLVSGVIVAVTLRNYKTKIKVSLRANLAIAGKAAEQFGGGGHPMAAGYRVEGGNIDKVQEDIIKTLTKLIKDHAETD